MSIALQDLGMLVKRLQYRHHRTLDIRLAPLGMSLVQWDALRAIGRHPDASSHHLAELTFQTDQSFGALAMRMVERGMIERLAGPGRALRHRLTAEGERLLQEGHQIVNEMLEASFAPLDAAERELLADLLNRLLQSPMTLPHPEDPT
jgi:DNA-binding MarR family transcriptional regulator